MDGGRNSDMPQFNDFEIDLDILEYIPEIKGNPQAMEVVAELVAKVTPLIPDMEIDRFIYDHDTDLYRGNVPNMTEGVSEITEALNQRDTRDIAVWLADIAADGNVPEESKRAVELLEKLAEYKPLPKSRKWRNRITTWSIMF